MFSCLRAIYLYPLLELQACFTGTVGNSLDATMIEVATAIEDHFGDAFLLCFLTDQLTELCGTFDRCARLSRDRVLKERRWSCR